MIRNLPETFMSISTSMATGCPQELKIETVSFRENPLLFACCRSPPGRDGHDGQGAARQGAWPFVKRGKHGFTEGLHGKPLHRLVTGYLLRKTRQGLASRESSRLDRARFFGMFRALARAMGRNLAQEKAIVDPCDVNHLTFEELKDYIMGSSADTDIKSLIALSQAAARYCSRTAVLPSACCCGEPCTGISLSRTVRRAITETPCGEAGAVLLQGIPCAPGTVEAEALVVDSPDISPPVSGKNISRADDRSGLGISHGLCGRAHCRAGQPAVPYGHHRP